MIQPSSLTFPDLQEHSTPKRPRMPAEMISGFTVKYIDDFIQLPKLFNIGDRLKSVIQVELIEVEKNKVETHTLKNSGINYELLSIKGNLLELNLIINDKKTDSFSFKVRGVSANIKAETRYWNIEQKKWVSKSVFDKAE